MKRTLLLLTAVLITATCHAQFSIAAKAGVNYNDYVADEESSAYDTDANIGFHAGGVFNIPVLKAVAFRPGILYVSRGFGKSNSKVAINYLDIPLLLSYSLAKKFSVEAGPVISYRLSAKGPDPFAQKRVDITSAIEPYSAGVTGGLSFNLSEDITLTAQYYHGLSYASDISLRDEKNNSIGRIKFFNRNILLGITYKIFKRSNSNS